MSSKFGRDGQYSIHYSECQYPISKTWAHQPHCRSHAHEVIKGLNYPQIILLTFNFETEKPYINDR